MDSPELKFMSGENLRFVTSLWTIAYIFYALCLNGLNVNLIWTIEIQICKSNSKGIVFTCLSFLFVFPNWRLEHRKSRTTSLKSVHERTLSRIILLKQIFYINFHSNLHGKAIKSLINVGQFPVKTTCSTYVQIKRNI